MTKLACRRCGCNALQRSRRRPFERLLSVFGVLPFRCDDCSHRSLYLVTRRRVLAHVRT